MNLANNWKNKVNTKALRGLKNVIYSDNLSQEGVKMYFDVGKILTLLWKDINYQTYMSLSLGSANDEDT